MRGYTAQIVDDRKITGIRNAFLWFCLERHASGDFKRMATKHSAGLIAKEWKALSGDEQQVRSPDSQVLTTMYDLLTHRFEKTHRNTAILQHKIARDMLARSDPSRTMIPLPHLPHQTRSQSQLLLQLPHKPRLPTFLRESFVSKTPQSVMQASRWGGSCCQ